MKVGNLANRITQVRHVANGVSWPLMRALQIVQAGKICQRIKPRWKLSVYHPRKSTKLSAGLVL